MRLDELIKDLDPITIIEFKNYLIENIGEICKTKNGVQKYSCSSCRYTCSETTDTIVSHSHLSFDV